MNRRDPLKSVQAPITVRIPTAVAMTGICRSKLYELIRSGELEVAKIGTSTLIKVDSLKRLINGQITG